MINKLKLTNLSALLVVVFMIAATVVFILFAKPYLDGESDVRWAADSADYILYFQVYGLDQTLIQLGQNLFGPLVFLWLVDGSHNGIFIINIVIYVIGWLVITKNIEVNKLVLFLGLAANPMFFVSLLAVNKEIIAFLVISFYSVYLLRGGLRWLVLALISAFFVRWQNVLVIMLFEFTLLSINPFRNRRWLFVAIVLLLLSLLYPLLDAQLGGVTTEQVTEQQTNTTFGILDVINDIQRNYGYFLVVIPKVFSNWFGNLPRVASLFYSLDEFDLSDVYNTFVITGHQAAMAIVFLLLAFKRKFKISNNLIYFSIFYSIIYSLGVFIQYRYYFPVYILFVLVLAQKSATQKQSSIV